MDSKLFKIIERFESSFSRKATYHCFTLLIIGLIVRGDHYGLSSIVRWLSLLSDSYWQILHFFNSTGWSLPGILLCWWSYCLEEAPYLMVQGRYVMIADHTNQPKEGQRMPEVITIHQNSETSSKPVYFRGHVWAFIGLIVEKAQSINCRKGPKVLCRSSFGRNEYRKKKQREFSKHGDEDCL